jgi:hypothetical protein
LTGVQKQADGTLTATGGTGHYNGWSGTLCDNDGDGKVFKLDANKTNNMYVFSADLKAGCDLTGKVS